MKTQLYNAVFLVLTSVHWAGFSPDGQRIATTSFDSTEARVWDVRSGEPVGKALRHEGW